MLLVRTPCSKCGRLYDLSAHREAHERTCRGRRKGPHPPDYVDLDRPSDPSPAARRALDVAVQRALDALPVPVCVCGKVVFDDEKAKHACSSTD